MSEAACELEKFKQLKSKSKREKKASFIAIDVNSFEAGVAFVVSGGSGPSPFLKTTVSSHGDVSPTSLTPFEGAGVSPEPPGLSCHRRWNR